MTCFPVTAKTITFSRGFEKHSFTQLWESRSIGAEFTCNGASHVIQIECYSGSAFTRGLTPEPSAPNSCSGGMLEIFHTQPDRYSDPLLSVCASANKRAVMQSAGKSNIVDPVMVNSTGLRSMPILRPAPRQSRKKTCADRRPVNRQPHMDPDSCVRSVEFTILHPHANAGEKVGVCP